MTPESTGACSEGCTGFHPVPGDPWSEFGLCRQSGSPQCGYPVRLGVPCARFTPRDYSLGKDGVSTSENPPSGTPGTGASDP